MASDTLVVEHSGHEPALSSRSSGTTTSRPALRDALRMRDLPEQIQMLQPRARNPASVAAAGVSGAGREIPHRSSMEASFGQDFSQVRAHTGSAAVQASTKLGANAFALGNDVAFRDANPSPALVAHELTHVVQRARGPQMHGGPATGVDTGGEAEADAVESAVAAGRPARSALRGGSGGGRRITRAGGGDLEPALDPIPGASFTFSPESFKMAGEVTIWKPENSIRIPIAGIPFINLTVSPSLKVVGSTEFALSGTEVEVALGVQGAIGVGISAGVKDVAEVYAQVGPQLAGNGKLKLHADGRWRLEAGLSLKLTGKVGVKIGGGGVLDIAYQFANLKLLKANLWKDTTGQGGDWGVEDDAKEVFRKTVQLYERARAYADRAGAAVAGGMATTLDSVDAALQWLERHRVEEHPGGVDSDATAEP